MGNVDRVLSELRDLSSKKERLTQQLYADNDELRELVDTVKGERDAFLDDNKAVMELLMKDGARESRVVSSASLKSSVEKLVHERNELKASNSQLKSVNARLDAERKSATHEREELLEEVRELKTTMREGKKRRDSLGSDRKSLQIKVWDVAYNTLQSKPF